MPKPRTRAAKGGAVAAGPAHSIYLIPGFFGFTNLGRLNYFQHVRDLLLARLQEIGVDARVHVVTTHPTAALPKRAVRVLEAIARTSGRAGPIHLIGHSTGGLDARLLVSPGVTLPTDLDVERHAARLRTVVTVATPHQGSPLASFLATIRGQRLLALLSVGTAYVLRFGRLPLAVVGQLATAFAPGDGLPLQRTLLDGIVSQLLAGFSVGRRRAVSRLLADVAGDQSLLVELMPEAMQLFAATVRARPGVRYGSVVTRAARPGMRSALATGLDPGAQGMHAVYQALYRIVAQPSRIEPARLTPAQEKALRRAYGATPAPSANDGIVPTRSQVFGEVICALEADHLDVIGHFSDAAADPPHYDWLTTGSGFDRPQFESAWRSVVAFLLSRG